MKTSAIGRMTIAVLVIVIVILAGLGIFLGVTTKPSSLTTMTSSESQTLVSTTGNSSQISNSSSSTSQQQRSILVMDDSLWPIGDFNVIEGFQGLPFPNWAQYTVYQTLVNLNESALYGSGITQYLPGLAENWTVSSNSTTYTFNLRHGIEFSSGDPFNAYVVWAEMYCTYYLTANSSTWLNSYDLFNMSSVDFGQSTLALLNQTGLANPSPAAVSIMENASWPIYVTNPYQIIFRQQAPFLWFLGTIVAFPGKIWDVNWAFQHGGVGAPAAINPYFNTHAIPGTGPYEIAQISENAFATFVQNPNYWGNNLTAAQIAENPFLDPGHVKKVIIFFKPDDISRYADLSTGTAQVATIESANWNLIISNPGKYSYYPVPRYSALNSPVSLNTKRYPTNITDVRLAIVHAINYTDLIDKAFLGQGRELIPPEYALYSQFSNPANLEPYSYNLSLAEQYLKAANLTSPPTLVYGAETQWEPGVVMGQVIQADLAQLNITVNIQLQQVSNFLSPYGSYSTNLNNSQVIPNIEPVQGATWGPGAVTPADAWVDFLSNGSQVGNTAIYYNPSVQNAINTFFTSNNQTYITSRIKQAEVQVYNDAPMISIQLGLWYGDGSLVWQSGTINPNFLVDPLTSGENTMPIFNTITFG